MDRVGIFHIACTYGWDSVRVRAARTQTNKRCVSGMAERLQPEQGPSQHNLFYIYVSYLYIHPTHTRQFMLHLNTRLHKHIGHVENYRYMYLHHHHCRHTCQYFFPVSLSVILQRAAQ